MICQLCKSPEPIQFLDLGQQPLANKYPSKEQFATEDFVPLAVHFCPHCKNVQLGTVISRERMFEDYFYLSSVNGKLVQHFEDLAKRLTDAELVVDVGSNDGILLKPLKHLGISAIGVEPSINVSKIANDQQLTTLCSFFDQGCAREINLKYGRPDVIVASSVFTHLEDPHDFLEVARDLMSPDGRLIIEVEYIGNILRLIQFERFYLDRIFYYSLTSLTQLMESHGLIIQDVEHIEPHGGSLRVIARRRDDKWTIAANVDAFLKAEEESLTIEKLRDFRSAVDTQIAALRELLTSHKVAGQKVAGYGAPARLSTICNYGNIGPSLIEFTVDDSPLKQKKYTPGTHIPIVPKSHLDTIKPDIIVAFAYEYIEDIRQKAGGPYRWLLPIPPKEIT
jgi:SAM-dependent methyltransferase